MASEKVLLITPFFAPQSHAAVFRTFKLAKYLPEFGFEPIVLTTDTNYMHKEDDGLLEQLPRNVEIHRARYIEPTVRGLRMALGGKDRTYASVGTSTNGNPSTQKLGEPGLVMRSYRWLIDNELYNPDPYWTWVKPALKVAQRLVKEKGIRVCLSSSYPYSSNVIGQGLKASGCRWVADFRDPLTYCHRATSSIESVYLKQKKIIDDTFEQADALTGLSSCYRLIFSELYPHHQSVQFIPTGLDDRLLPDSSLELKNQIIFTGEYLPIYDGRIFEVFRKSLDSRRIPEDSRILIVGNRDMNQPRLQSRIEKWNLLDHVEFVDQLPQRELYRLIAESRAGLLNPGDGATWWTNFAKMVDFIAMEKPVLAAVADPSEARTELSKAGLGIFLDGPLEKDIEKLSSVFAGEFEGARSDYCHRYLAKSMTEAFAKVFSGVLTQSGQPE